MNKKERTEIKVVLYQDRIEIQKLGISIPYSTLDYYRIGMVVARIIQEISRATGIPENEILLVKSFPNSVLNF
ncbi:MAG: hypothetical protein WBX01_01730 [Nitrososphaeraceae archaeon]